MLIKDIHPQGAPDPIRRPRIIILRERTGMDIALLEIPARRVANLCNISLLYLFSKIIANIKESLVSFSV